MNKLNFSEGIFEFGYGKIYQTVLKDTSLSMTAKSIYLYLCSCSNKEGICYPRVSTILRDLNIAKNNYYAKVKELIVAGYISIDKCKKAVKGLLNKNIYRIRNDVIINRNNNLNVGYGFIGRVVMADTELSCKAKALLGYYWSLAQSDNIVYPNAKQVCNDLNISNKLYGKLKKELMNNEYIIVYKNVIGLNDFTNDTKQLVESWYKANCNKKPSKINDLKSILKKKMQKVQKCDNANGRNCDNDNSTNTNNTNTNIISSNILSRDSKTSNFDLIKLKNNINFSKLKTEYGNLIDLVIKTANDIIANTGEIVQVGRNRIAKSQVISKLKVLTYKKMKPLLDRLKGKINYVHNPLMYIRVCLYKASEQCFEYVKSSKPSNKFMESSFDIEELEKIK